MLKKRVNRGALIATSAMLLLTSSAFGYETSKDSVSSGTVKPVKCYGVNSCRGKGQCGSKANHSCAGQNACKGKAWIYMSEDQCKKQGGTKVE